MSRRYGQVPLSLWRAKPFRALSDDARLAVLFFWCGPHSTSAGIGLVPDTYAASDLGWPIERWKAARKEAAQSNFIQHDEATETVLVCGYLAANRPVNAKHRAAIVGQINAMECDTLRNAATKALTALDAEGSKSASLPEGKSDLSPQFRSLMAGRL